jgi:nickel transport protein
MDILRTIVLGYVVAAVFMTPRSAFSHGTDFEILRSDSIRIRASFDTGEPMALANVLVFRPGLRAASDTLRTDADGVFAFSPDCAGVWTFQVRDRSGHGMRINLEINEDLQTGPPRTNAGGGTYPQKLIMAACVVWGLLGTALYFKKRKT